MVIVLRYENVPTENIIGQIDADLILRRTRKQKSIILHPIITITPDMRKSIEALENRTLLPYLRRID